LLVIDNASPDDSAERIRAAHPDVEVLKTSRNGGYAAGMNCGIRSALRIAPEYLLIMNSDTITDRDFLRRLVEALDQNPDAAAASGTIYQHPGREKVWYAGGSIRYWRASAFSSHRLPTPPNRTRSVSFLSGCAFLIRSGVVQEVGMFDERFFMYLEDTELCARLRRRKFKLLYVPEAAISHKVYETAVTPVPLYFSVRNRFLFLRLAARGPQRYIGFLYLSAVLSIKMLVWLLRGSGLFAAARTGVRDFGAGRFYEGSSVRFTDTGSFS
jgi:GT2 family glycosyltransferase